MLADVSCGDADGIGMGGAGGSLRVGVAPESASGAGARLVPSKSTPLRANATSAAVEFEGGADWSELIGTAVRLEVQLTDASVFTLGWGE